MGRVFLAGAPDGRLVALKLVHARHVEEPGFLERFRRVNGSLTPDARIIMAECDAGWAAAHLTSAIAGNAKIVYRQAGGVWKAVEIGSYVCGGVVDDAPGDVRSAVNC